MKPSTSLGTRSNVGMVNPSPLVRQAGNIRGLLRIYEVYRRNILSSCSHVKDRCRCRDKVHVTETCDDDAPHLITHVETTAGPVADGKVTPRIHHALERKGVLPATHIVDTGYLDAELLVTSQRDYGVDLLGPTRANYHWQARAAQGFDASSFAIDWDQRQARCPCGHFSASWTPTVDKRKNEVVQVQFSTN